NWSIDDARKDDFGLARGSESDAEPGRDQRENALLATGVRFELDAAAHERGIELASGVTVVPALNQEGFPPQTLPVDCLVLREWMLARDCRDNPLAVEGRRRSVGPQRVTR